MNVPGFRRLTIGSEEIGASLRQIGFALDRRLQAIAIPFDSIARTLIAHSIRPAEEPVPVTLRTA